MSPLDPLKDDYAAHPFPAFCTLCRRNGSSIFWYEQHVFFDTPPPPQELLSVGGPIPIAPLTAGAMSKTASAADCKRGSRVLSLVKLWPSAVAKVRRDQHPPPGASWRSSLTLPTIQGPFCKGIRVAADEVASLASATKTRFTRMGETSAWFDGNLARGRYGATLLKTLEELRHRPRQLPSCRHFSADMVRR